PEPGEIAAALPALPSTRTITSSRQTPGASAVIAVREATYAKPYIAHASIGLSCALAEFRDGKLTLWSHTQGPHHLRAQIARVLGMAENEVEVVHRDGAGCYGHNGADDVALDAALLSRACCRRVVPTATRSRSTISPGMRWPITSSLTCRCVSRRCAHSEPMPTFSPSSASST